jgi:hypothetical protein
VLRKHVGLCGLLVFGLIAVSSRQAISQEPKTGGTLQVRVNYIGSGTIDDRHKIYVVLWDSPRFVEEGSKLMPIQVEPVASKNGTAVFKNVSAKPTYVSAAYDPTGQWKAKSSPPAGSSLGLHTKSGGNPEAVTVNSGKTASVEITFDDSFKWRRKSP